MDIEYVDGGKELLIFVKPLWEKLRNHHRDHAKHFSDMFAHLSFDERNKKLTDAIQLKIDLVKDKEKNTYIAFCISTVNKDSIGEVDALFIEPEYRRLGIGDQLMKRTLDWQNQLKVKAKIIGVAEGNEQAMDFYMRYGFYKRRTILQEVSEDAITSFA